VGYSFDDFGRIYASSTQSQSTSYNYGGQNFRTSKNGPNGATRFIYAPEGVLLAELQVGGAWTNYIYLENEIVGLTRGASLYFVHNDQMGRPEVITNSAQSAVWAANNFAFDRTPTNQTLGAMNVGLPGQYWDTESGTWYNVRRYYDPSIGRYISSDPIGLEGGINTYVYVLGDPINRIDPTGLDDLILFRSGTVFYQGAQANFDTPGIWNVYGHGDPSRIVDQTGKKNADLNGKSLAQKLKDAGFKGGPVILWSCRTGAAAPNGADNLAQETADALQTTVYAPTQFVWYNPFGLSGIWGKNPSNKSTQDFNNPGRMVPFYPRARQ
jgi:RHS repeat-associated protein